MIPCNERSDSLANSLERYSLYAAGEGSSPSPAVGAAFDDKEEEDVVVGVLVEVDDGDGPFEG